MEEVNDLLLDFTIVKCGKNNPYEYLTHILGPTSWFERPWRIYILLEWLHFSWFTWLYADRACPSRPHSTWKTSYETTIIIGTKILPMIYIHWIFLDEKSWNKVRCTNGGCFIGRGSKSYKKVKSTRKCTKLDRATLGRNLESTQVNVST